MAEKLFRSERESEREEESGSNRIGVKETDFDNRAPVDHNCEEKKKNVHSVQEFRSWNWMGSKERNE